MENLTFTLEQVYNYFERVDNGVQYASFVCDDLYCTIYYDGELNEINYIGNFQITDLNRFESYCIK